MADPRLRQLTIQTGVVKRISKEKVCYEKEAEQFKRRLEKLKDEGKDESVLKKQEECIQESLMMVPDCQRRLAKAYEQLETIIQTELELKETKEYEQAAAVLEDAKAQLPSYA